jgi:outer membrane protein assembly factor BamB
MRALFLTFVILPSLSDEAIVRLDETDPEPPPSRWAKADGVTVRVHKDGEVTATDGDGKTLWRAGTSGRGRVTGVFIVGEQVVVGHERTLSVLNRRTGKVIWERASSSPLGKMSRKGDQVLLKRRASVEVIDLR